MILTSNQSISHHSFKDTNSKYDRYSLSFNGFEPTHFSTPNKNENLGDFTLSTKRPTKAAQFNLSKRLSISSSGSISPYCPVTPPFKNVQISPVEVEYMKNFLPILADNVKNASPPKKRKRVTCNTSNKTKQCERCFTS
jgi:hypothetical protein